MINLINTSINSNISNKFPLNNKSCAFNSFYLSPNSCDSVSFNGKSRALKEIFKPTYIDSKQVPVLMDKLTTKICDLSKSNDFNSKSLKTIMKDIAPNSIFLLKDKNKIPVLLSILNKIGIGRNVTTSIRSALGYAQQRNIGGLKRTEIRASLNNLRSGDSVKRISEMSVIGHELNHSLRFNTKDGNAFLKSKKLIFNHKYHKVYLDSQNMVVNQDFIDEYLQTKNSKMFDDVIDSLFEKHNITQKKEKIKNLKFLHTDVLYESEAYKTGFKIEDILNGEKDFAEFPVMDDFAESIQRRYIAEGGDPSKLTKL